jgi:hypothetical protein
MNELLIVAIAIVLLLIIIFKVRKRIRKFPESTIQAEKNKLANKPIVDTEPKKKPLPEPQAKEPLRSTEPKSELIEESKTKETITRPKKYSDDNLPKDSMLRRHYLTHLRSMIESINSPRPTDSCLSRHYDSLIIAEIEQCVCDKGAIEQLIYNYEGHKKTSVRQVQKPKILAEPLLKAEINPEDTVVQPEGSVSSQNTDTNASAESNIPLPPTDSVLRRHYDTMINTK